MRIIDAHVHSIGDKDVCEFAKKYKIDYSERGLEKECRQNNIKYALSMACDFSTPTPMGVHMLKLQQSKHKMIVPLAGVNAFLKVTANQIKETEHLLKNGIAKGIKIYLGYMQHYATDKIYFPFYKMAEKHNCPIIFHTGDTFGSNAMLKYSHPLTIDEAAVKFPKTKFILAHLGNPWVIDAAEVVYKNPNVFADLSGFAMGKINKQDFALAKEKIRYALDYVKDSKKFVYGTDWPLVSMQDYLRMMKKIVPSSMHKDIFYNNALNLFKLE